MEKKQIYEVINNSGVMYLATTENGEARVRAMMLYRADENGIVFHTGPFKDVYKQILENPNVQMCFYEAGTNTQIRVRGRLEESNDQKLKEEIASHPSRSFMQSWRQGKTDEEFYAMFSVFTLRGGLANVWTFMSNFEPKEDIAL